MRRSRFIVGVVGSSWVRPLVLLLGLVLVSGSLFSAGVPVPPSLMSRADVVTPKQRWGSAKGRPHLVSGKQTTAKADGKKRSSKRPTGAPPLERPFKPQVVTSSRAKRPAPPNKVKFVAPKDPVKVTGFDEKKSVEDPAQRSRFTYRYANPDGTWTARVFDRPVNYQDHKGAFQPIDARLVDDGKGYWRNKADSTTLRFSGHASAQDLATMELGGGRRFGFGVTEAAPVQGQVGGDTVTYEGVHPDTDLVLQSLSGGSVKEKIVLNSAEAVSEWEFPLRTDGLAPRLAADGSVEVVDASGAVVLHIPHGFMVDSKIDPRSGEGIRSDAVTYALEQRGGGWVLKVTADREWLADPARVFPVTVDPTAVWSYSNTADTYVQTGYGSSPYSEHEVKIGTYNGGGSKAATYLGFSQVDNQLSHSKIYDVDLFMYNYWSSSCADAPVTVHPVTQDWSQGSIANYPGPKYGAALSSRSFANGWTDGSGAPSPCPAKWEGIDLGKAGNSLVQSWVDHTKPNYGLTVRASTTSSSGWKRFSSSETGGGPYLNIVYSPYNASYAFASSPPTFNPPILNNQAGAVKVKVTNKGRDAWTATGDYKLTYAVFDKSGKQLYHVPAETSMPSTVSYGETVTVNAKVKALPPGTWKIVFDMIKTSSGSGYALFSEWGVPRTAAVSVAVPDIPTQLNEMSPHNNFQVGSLTPQLFADAQSVDAWPSAAVSYQFTVCAPPWLEWEWCLNSAWKNTPKWTVPKTDATKKLAWGKEYYWTVAVSDSGGSATYGPWYKFTTGVPQPEITAHLADSAPEGREFDDQTGNFITSATDAIAATAGPPLSVSRTYNSLDPRTNGLFGAGWTTRYDMRVVPDADDSGNIVVTYPTGREVRFAKDPSGGTYTPPTGLFATLTDVIGGGWKLRDKSSTIYQFNGDGKLTSITDHRGRTQTLTYGWTGHLDKITSNGGRSLTLEWNPLFPTHVLSVSTDPVNGTPLKWTYSYDGDKLTKVCPPTSATECTTYSYGAGSHFRTTVLDDNPTGYWRMGESSGTIAKSEAAQNLGADNGTHASVTLGAAGALAGTSDKAVTFNGSTSRVRLPDRFISRESGFLSVEAWFKTTGTGVIFAYQNAGIGSTPTKYTPAVYIGTDGYLRGQFWNGTANPIRYSDSAVNNGQWHHVVLSGVGGTQTLYLDGAAAGTRTGTIDHDNQQYVYVGNGYSGGSGTGWHYTPTTAGNFAFTGTIDDVAVYDKPLGLPAVQQHYAARAEAQQLTQATLPSGRVQAANTYDTGQDRLATHTDQGGGTWQLGTPTYSGTADDPIKTVTLGTPRGGSITSTYQVLRGNRLLSETDQLGKITTYEYDADGRLAKITDPNGNETALWFDERGNKRYQKQCRDADTCYAEFWNYYVNADDPFDPRNDQLTSYEDGRTINPFASPYTTIWEYDSHGQQTAELFPPTEDYDFRGIGYSYTGGTEPAIGGGTTPPGLLKTRLNAKGSTAFTFAYTAAGDLAQVTDAAGKVTKYTYDQIGRAVSKSEVTAAYPDGVTTTYAYDGVGRLIRSTGPGVGNEVSSEVHTAQTAITYDADGNRLTQTLTDTSGNDPERTSRFTYDTRGRLATVTDPEGGTKSYGYDVAGAVTSITDQLGTQYRYSYTTRGELATRTLKDWTGNPDNPVSARDVVLDSYAYDDGGRLASRTDVMGRTTAYTYYGDDRLAQTIAKGVRVNDSTTPRDVVTQARTYDGAGHLTSLVTGDGKYRTDYVYDETGQRIAQIIDPDGVARRTDLKLDPNDNITKTIRTAADTEDQEVTRYAYDDLSRLTERTVENGDQDLTTSITRDQRGLVTAVVDPRGNTAGATAADFTTNMRYDAAGQLVEVTQPPVQVERGGGAPATTRPATRYGYNAAGQQTHIIDPENRTTTIGYDKAGRTTSTTSPPYTPPGGTAITPTASIGYDAAGRVTRQTDPRGGITRYAYDALGNLVHRDDPQLSNENNPGRWSYEYDLAGEPLSATGPLGARIEATYDDLGCLVTLTEIERKPSAAAFTTKLAYDEAGNLTSKIRPTGDASTYSFDGAGQVTQLTDPLNRSATLSYDLAGRPNKVTDPLGHSIVGQSDPAGRLVAVKDLDTAGTLLRTRSFAYDPAGNRTTETDAEGHTIQRAYDSAGRLTSLTEPVTAGSSIVTSFGYDAAGQQTRLTDGRGNATITTYNTLGLPESVIEPATSAHPDAADRTFTTSYDAAGNPVHEALPGGVGIDRTFDELGRLTLETGSGAEAATTDRRFGYDLAGNRLRVSAPGDDILTTYNDRGLPLSINRGATQTAQLSYDANGRLTHRTDPVGQTWFAWNADDQLAATTDQVTGGTLTRSYDQAGRLDGISYGTTGTTRTLGYDALDRVTSDQVKNASGSVLASVAYSYDNNDRLTGKTTTGTTGAGSNTYTYDQSGRLTGWTNPAGTTTGYTWDASGNRTSAGSTTATYDQRNRLTTSGATTYTYAARGTTATESASGSTRTYAFDAFDRMVTDAAGTVVGYTYDGLDRAATRTESGATTNYSGFTYSTDQNDVTATTDNAGTIKAGYTRTPDGDILSVRQYGTPYHAISDRHQDLTGLLSQDATTLAGSVAYDPFGRATSTTGTQTRAGYQGEYTDPTTGRVNMHARWYTPTTGTFNTRDDWTLNPDPSTQANRYTYANAAPLDGTDPSGHSVLYPTFGGLGGFRFPSFSSPWSYARAAGPYAGGLGAVGMAGYAGYLAAPYAAGFLAPGFSSYAPGMNMAIPNTGCALCAGGIAGAGANGAPGVGTAAGRVVPRPRPTPAQIQKKQAEWARDHPAPRPPVVNSVTQKQVDKLRDAVEKTVKTVASVNNTAGVVKTVQGAFNYQAAQPDVGLTILPTPAHPGLGTGTELIPDAAQGPLTTTIPAEPTAAPGGTELLPDEAQQPLVTTIPAQPANGPNILAAELPSSVEGLLTVPQLKELAREIRTSGGNPQAVDRRTIAVGQMLDGSLYAGSSNGFDRGMREAAKRLGINPVPSSRGHHAEENLMKWLNAEHLFRVGTDKRAPCGSNEHNCAGQLDGNGIEAG